MDKMLGSPWGRVGLLFLILCLLNGRAYDAGFVTDFTGLWAKMQGAGLRDALTSFGFPSLMPVLNLLYFSLYSIVGLSPLPWFVVAALLSAGALTLYSYTLEYLLTDSRVSGRVPVLLSAIFLVLASPYQVEAMIWKVGLGHLSAVFFFMAALLYTVRYMRRGIRWAVVGMAVFLSMSLLCFEWGMVFPAIAGLIGLPYALGARRQVRRLVTVLSVSSLVVLLYLIANVVFLGKWIGHYEIGSEVSLGFSSMVTTMMQYFVKHLTFMHFWPYDLKRLVYDGVGSYALVSLSLLVIAGAYGMYAGGRARMMSVALGSSIISLVLVSGLFFHYLQLSENDRYGSLFVYFYSFLLALIVMRGRWWQWILIFLFVVVSLYFQQKMVHQWVTSQMIIDQTVDSYEQLGLNEEDTVLMLNLPENHKGTFIYRDYEGDNPFEDQLDMMGVTHPDLQLVAQYNPPRLDHPFSAKWMSSDRIRLESAKWGAWWWRAGKGGGPYRTDSYSFHPKDKDMEVQLLSTDDYDLILYWDGAAWRRL